MDIKEENKNVLQKSVKFTEKFALNEVKIKANEQIGKIVKDYIRDYLYSKDIKGIDPYKIMLKTLPGKRFIIDCGKNIDILRRSYSLGLINLKDAEYIIKLTEKAQLPSIYSAIASLKRLIQKEKLEVSDEIVNVANNILENSGLYNIEGINPVKMNRTESKSIDNLMKEYTIMTSKLTDGKSEELEKLSTRSDEFGLIASIGSINVMAYQAYLNGFLTFKETDSIIQDTMKKLKEVGDKNKIIFAE